MTWMNWVSPGPILPSTSEHRHSWPSQESAGIRSLAGELTSQGYTHLLPVIQAQPWLAQHIRQFGQGSL